MDAPFWITLVFFAVTYLALALGKVPGLRMDRASIALVGATAMLVTRMLSFEEAFSAKCIDYKVLVLLFGMMVVSGTLELTGVFTRLVVWFLSRIHTPHGLLATTIFLSGVLSAFLVNDIICIALTPLVLRMARALRFDPVPHLLGLATASNIGSAATITGNPQNMIIGTLSEISYLRFSARLFPVALVSLGVAHVLIAWLYRKRLVALPATTEIAPVERNRVSRLHQNLQRKAVLVAVGTVVLFFALPSKYLALVALGAAALLLLGRINPDKLYRQVDWSLLVMFAGLFIVVHSFNTNVVRLWNVAGWTWLRDSPVVLLSLVSAGLSNLVSNVPAVLLFPPVLAQVAPGEIETAWLALALSSTLAGNLTVLGSVANLIVVEYARRQGVQISFVEYCKVGIPLTLITLTLGVAWMSCVRY